MQIISFENSLLLIDTKNVSFDMQEIENRRFMYSPQSGELIIGKQYKIKDVSGGGAKLWTLQGNVFTPVFVQTGITDGTHTEILSGVNEGDVIVADIVAGNNVQEEEESNQASGNSPFMPGPRNRDNKKNSDGNKKQ